MTDEDREIMRAVERFCAAVALPVLHEPIPDVVDQVGTGTLFDVDGRLLLITAGHIFDQIKPEDLVIPSTKTTTLHGIGPYHLYRADIEEIDIAIVELRHPPSIERARDGWHVLTLANIAEPSIDGHFILTGYPSERVKRKGGLLGGSFLALHTQRLAEPPPGVQKPAASDLDLFFKYGQEAEALDGSRVAVPKLPGCSGAPVWEYAEPEGMRFWSAAQCLRVVGIQSSYIDRKGFFRVKRWEYVRAMIAKLLAEHPVESRGSEA